MTKRLIASLALAVAAGACSVDFDGKEFCKPHCDGGAGAGGASTSSTGAGTTESTGGGGAGGSGGSSSSSAGGADCSVPVDDEFSGYAPSPCWKPIHHEEETHPMTIDGGNFVIQPDQGDTWLDGAQAPAIVQTLGEQNFALLTHVDSQYWTNPTQPPANPFSAAGILVRMPDPTSGETVMVYDIGRHDQGLGLYMYRTTDGLSSGGVPVLADGKSAELVLCRIDTLLHVFHKLDDEDVFTEDMTGFATNDFADAPALEVGLTAHANQVADIVARFAYARFKVGVGVGPTVDTCTDFP